MESGNKKWAPPETKNLISEFEETPCLWNVFDKGYTNKDMKAAALEKIALSLGFSAVEIKRKLHNLRCQFTSELQKTVHKKSGQGASDRYKSQWPYFYSLKFLESAVNVRETAGNLLLQPGETTGRGLETKEEEEISQVGVL
jgi:hypothetical protein